MDTTVPRDFSLQCVSAVSVLCSSFVTSVPDLLLIALVFR